MTATHAALLRGINVGKAKRVAMADLRELFESLGHRDVRTLLNSGNVVFTPPRRARGDTAGPIEKAIATKLGVATRVTILTRDELATAVGGNPLVRVATDPSRLLVTVIRDPKLQPLLKPLLKQAWTPEALGLGGRVAYLWCASGIVDSPLWKAVGRILGEEGTARNMATMTKLLAMMEE